MPCGRYARRASCPRGDVAYEGDVRRGERPVRGGEVLLHLLEVAEARDDAREGQDVLQRDPRERGRIRAEPLLQLFHPRSDLREVLVGELRARLAVIAVLESPRRAGRVLAEQQPLGERRERDERQLP